MLPDKLDERVAKAKKVRELTPTKHDLMREFGEENYREHSSGKWRYDFKKKDGSVDMKKLNAFREMLRPARRVEASAALELAPKAPEREKPSSGICVTVPALPWHKERPLNLAGER